MKRLILLFVMVCLFSVVKSQFLADSTMSYYRRAGDAFSEPYVLTIVFREDNKITCEEIFSHVFKDMYKDGSLREHLDAEYASAINTFYYVKTFSNGEVAYKQSNTARFITISQDKKSVKYYEVKNGNVVRRTDHFGNIEWERKSELFFNGLYNIQK